MGMELSELPSKLQQCLLVVGGVEEQRQTCYGLDAFIILLFGCNFLSIWVHSLRFWSLACGSIALGKDAFCDSKQKCYTFIENSVKKLNHEI